MSCTPKICITIYNLKKQSNSSFQYFYHKTKTQNSYSYQDTNWSKLCFKLQPLITHNKHQQKDQHPHQLSHSNQNPIKKKQTLKLKDPNHCKKEKKPTLKQIRWQRSKRTTWVCFKAQDTEVMQREVEVPATEAIENGEKNEGEHERELSVKIETVWSLGFGICVVYFIVEGSKVLGWWVA